ncbi:MarR family winged helix-turn-helix transcriptional regulator [Clostridium nigeriense]|uniref:MarR family winged helix-turn-helix transcriptional regulator n=1 Tax=Clostridium nigeriense TaxID=1805470 RepID=UPI003D328DE1
MDNVNLKLVIAMARTYDSLFFEVEKSLKEFELNISEFGVLEMLYHKGDQPVQKVAEKILVTSGTITYVINKLEKKDFVVRRKCNKDKRVYYVSLTEKGHDFIDYIFPKHKDFIDNLFKDISEENKIQLLENLIQLRKVLK